MKTTSQAGAFSWVLIILATCGALFLFQKLLWLIVPLLLSLMLYYIIRPIVNYIVRSGMERKIAVPLTMGILFLLTLAVVLYGAQVITVRSTDWQAASERYVKGGLKFVHSTAEALEERWPVLKKNGLSKELDRQQITFVDEFMKKHLATFALHLLAWLPSLLLVPYLTYFLIKDGNRLKKQVIRSVPNAFFEKTLLLFGRVDESLQSFFQGLLALTLLDTLCLGIGLLVLGVSSPIALGLIAAVLAWIPVLGSVAGCILVTIVAATDFPTQPSMAYGCIGLFLVVRLLDDFVWMPLTIGRNLHLHPLLTVVMLFLGAAVAGAAGLVMVLPVLGVIAVVVEVLVQIVTDRRLMARYYQAKAKNFAPVLIDVAPVPGNTNATRQLP